MTRIILINGHVACLKTTLAYLLAPALGFGHVTTSVLGPIVSDATASSFNNLRDARYSALTDLTASYLRNGTSVVLDGTFAHRRWREAIYRVAATAFVTDIVSITCVSSSADVVAKRLAYRHSSPDVPDSAANQWDAYLGSVSAFESPDTDTVPDGISFAGFEFDSARLELRLLSGSAFAEVVASALERIVESGRLAHPNFGMGAMHSSDDIFGLRLVALEGLGGSGKTTQAGMLARHWAAKGLSVQRLTEFSDGPVGRLLASCTAKADHRVQLTGKAPSHTESLLVIGDAVRRVEQLGADRRMGRPVYDVVVADSYAWSHLAHAVALLPSRASTSIVDAMSTSVSNILAPLHGVCRVESTVYLRLEVKVARKRIESRTQKRVSTQGVTFLERIHAIYEELSSASNSVVIDAAASPTTVCRRIIRAVGL
jgi:thymidylate kinase